MKGLSVDAGVEALMGMPALRIFAGSIAVIVLLLLVLLLLRRFVRGGRAGKERRLQLLETQAIGAKQRLLVVRFDEEELLLGVSPTEIRTLASRRVDAPAVVHEAAPWPAGRDPEWASPEPDRVR